MTTVAMDIAKMVDMLPENDQIFAYEFVKKLVLAWDPDYTKVTSVEYAEIADAEQSGFLAEEEIDLDHLEKYAK